MKNFVAAVHNINALSPQSFGLKLTYYYFKLKQSFSYSKRFSNHVEYNLTVERNLSFFDLEGMQMQRRLKATLRNIIVIFVPVDVRNFIDWLSKDMQGFKCLKQSNAFDVDLFLRIIKIKPFIS